MCAHVWKRGEQRHSTFVDGLKKTNTQTNFSTSHRVHTYTTPLCVSAGLTVKGPVKRGWKWCLSFPVGKRKCTTPWLKWQTDRFPSLHMNQPRANYNLLFPGQKSVHLLHLIGKGKKGKCQSWNVFWKEDLSRVPTCDCLMPVRPECSESSSFVRWRWSCPFGWIILAVTTAVNMAGPATSACLRPADTRERCRYGDKSACSVSLCTLCLYPKEIMLTKLQQNTCWIVRSS